MKQNEFHGRRDSALATWCLAGFMLISISLSAQTPSDAIMMVPKQICGGVFFDHNQFDQYYQGSLLRVNGTIETVYRNSYTPMVAVGILPRINFLVGLPYVSTWSSEPNGGKFQGVNGFQDLTLTLKGKVFTQTIGKGDLNFLASTSFSFKASNYLSDYRPYSIGNGTDEFTLRGILQYKLNVGLYVRGTVGYNWLGDSKAERDYYYNNGSYYTDLMDVPNAWSYEGVVGWWLFNESLKLEADYVAQSSTSGDDIRPYNAAQPTNKVDFGHIGFTGEYYLPIPAGLAVHGSWYQTTSGRNVGKSTGFSAGLTYFFFVGHHENMEQSNTLDN